MLINTRRRGLLTIAEDSPPGYVPDIRYDDEGSQRSSIGSVIVGKDAYWRATITVPLPKADTVFVQIEREGTLPRGYVGAEETTGWSMPISELDYVVELLARIIRQGRRDGVIG